MTHRCVGGSLGYIITVIVATYSIHHSSIQGTAIRRLVDFFFVKNIKDFFILSSISFSFIIYSFSAEINKLIGGWNNYLQLLSWVIIESLLCRGFPRPIWPAKYHERSEGYFAGQIGQVNPRWSKMFNFPKKYKQFYRLLKNQVNYGKKSAKSKESVTFCRIFIFDFVAWKIVPIRIW